MSRTKSSDMGIDGYTFEGDPIQVKQLDDVGRNVIDNFQTALRPANSKEGVIVAFSFGRGAYEEISRCKLRDGLEIKAIKIEDLLENIRLNHLNQLKINNCFKQLSSSQLFYLMMFIYLNLLNDSVLPQ